MIGDFLKKKRLEKGLTLKEVSILSHVSFSTLSLIENNKEKPKFITLRKLSETYNVKFERLVKELNKEEK